LGKPNPSFEKRAREQKKRLKRAEKARRKAERDAAKKLGASGEADTNDPSKETDPPATGPDESAERPD
jgi:hypothetical protein